MFAAAGFAVKSGSGGSQSGRSRRWWDGGHASERGEKGGMWRHRGA